MPPESTDKNINPIDNVTIITSVTFISICIGLIIFIKKFPIDPKLNVITMVVLSTTTTLFGISALISYIDVARTYCKVEEILSTKFLAYLFGIMLFGISAMIVIYYI